MFDLMGLIDKLPAEIDGKPIHLYKNKENWYVAYDAKDIILEKGKTLLEATQKMLERLNLNK